MIRVMMEAGQAQVGDEIQLAGLSYRITDVEYLPTGNVSIQAQRDGTSYDDLEGYAALYLDPEVQFEIVAPDQDGQS